MSLQINDRVLITNGLYKDIKGTIMSENRLGFYFVKLDFDLPSRHYTEKELKKIEIEESLI